MKQTTSKRAPRPRNFLARHPLMKKGGVHQKPKKALRKAAKQRLKNECSQDYPGGNVIPLGNISAREFGRTMPNDFI